jgi:predicted DNA-binding transcriptional regulator AlpA
MMSNFLETLPVDIARHRIFKTNQAAEFWGVSVVQWRRMVREKRVPAPIHISTRRLGWRAGDLIDALAARAAIARCDPAHIAAHPRVDSLGRRDPHLDGRRVGMDAETTPRISKMSCGNTS